MSFKIMLVDDEPAGLARLERLFGRAYQVVAACPMEAKDRHVYGHARRVSGYAVSEMASLNALPTHRLATLRLSRADLARVRELTGGTVYGRLDRAAA